MGIVEEEVCSKIPTMRCEDVHTMSCVPHQETKCYTVLVDACSIVPTMECADVPKTTCVPKVDQVCNTVMVDRCRKCAGMRARRSVWTRLRRSVRRCLLRSVGTTSRKRLSRLAGMFITLFANQLPKKNALKRRIETASKSWSPPASLIV